MAKQKDNVTQKLFSDGQELFDDSYEKELVEQKKEKVECLGQVFENDDARREHFGNKLREGLEELHEKLAVPFESVEQVVGVLKSVENWPMGNGSRLRKLAEKMRITDDSNKDILQRWKDEIGFPHGEIEDILNLSDPPYYTACPNPFLGDFVKQFGTPFDPNDGYRREPFAADVSEGKTDPFYRAHSYHTKVPHKAIMRYILHYTEPGDLVFDGFCGTGMTGIAAQMCGEKASVKSLGYEVKRDGIIHDEEGNAFSIFGTRKAILNDLAPVATFITSKYNLPFSVRCLEREANRLLKWLETEYGWMYETKHIEERTGKTIICRINYTVWSEVFSCNHCNHEMVFTEVAFDEKTGKVKESFECPSCSSICTKNELQLLFETILDRNGDGTIQVPKRAPVLINYSIGKTKHERKPDSDDLAILKKIEQLPFPSTIPTEKFPDMQMGRVGRMKTTKVDNLHLLFLPRQAMALGLLWARIKEVDEVSIRSGLFWVVEQSITGFSILNRYSVSHFSQVNRAMSGVLYVPSQISECSPWYNLEGKFKRVVKAFKSVSWPGNNIIITTGDCSKSEIAPNSIDYIFTDPPFGENIYYSDLNLITEAWHRVKTNSSSEAIVDRVKKRTLFDYQGLMTLCFQEYYRVLKPGRWITVEFSNTKASVWNSIQTSLSNAGFIVANVSALDKKQGTFQAVNSPTAVKQDLVISAYKPNGGFEERFEKEAETEEGVWDFVRTHLRYLPTFKGKTGEAEFIPERDPRILYDQLVAFYVRHGIPVPISSQEFQAGLREKFSERDGMYFLSHQAAEYDKKRMLVKDFIEMKLFVDDEASAIQWLRQQLKIKPQTYQEIQPQFMQQISGWKKSEQTLELAELLEDNFLKYDSSGKVPSQIHSYLSTDYHDLRNLAKDDPILKTKAKDRWYVPDPNKEADLEKKREKALLREFEEYRQLKQKKLKVFRIEAVRAGFKKAWQDRDYQTIIDIAEKIPDATLQEDNKLLMWYDQAITRMGV